MDLATWQRHAFEDQYASTDERGSHLYANFGHSCRTKLISNACLACFRAALGAISPGVYTSEEGPAGAIVQEARKAAPADFRLLCREFTPAPGDVFVNLRQQPVGPSVTMYGAALPVASAATVAPSGVLRLGAANPGKMAVLRRHRPSTPAADRIVIWVTRQDSVIDMLADHRPKDQQDMVRLLVNSLGLKPNGGSWTTARSAPWQVEVTLSLYRVQAGQPLRRPHALSGGYVDRFSGYTTNRPFGSTAESSTGRPCLPEAITRLSELEAIGYRDPDYDQFCSTLERVNPRLANRYPDGRLGAIISSAAFEPPDYLRIQKQIVAYLTRSRRRGLTHPMPLRRNPLPRRRP